MRPTERLSLRWRVAAMLTLVTLLAVVAQATALLLTANEDEEDLIDEILGQQIERGIEDYFDHPGQVHPVPPRMRLYVDGEAGERAPAQVRALGVGNHEIFLGDTEYHVAVRSRNGKTFRLAFDVSEHERRLDLLARMVFGSSVVVGVLVLGLSYGLAGLLLARVAGLARRVESEARAPDPTPFLCAGMEPEVRSLAAALDRYREQHRRLLEREREFTADVSHELRTPLTGIRTSAELIADDPRVDERVRRRAVDIVAAADRMTGLARALLFLARELPQGRAEPVALARVVEQALDPLRAGARAKGLDLAVDVSGDAQVRAVPGMLDLVVGNLIGNAVRYTERGAVAVRWQEGDEPRLVVSDTGPGIDPQKLPQIFERYARGQERGDGLGLGLAIARRVCEAYGWRLELAAAAGGGTRASVVFPDFT